jgi:hypothetical protein
MNNKVIYLTDVVLLCTACKQPIKAVINTSQWIRCEFIGPEGECLACVQRKKLEAKSSSVVTFEAKCS